MPARELNHVAMVIVQAPVRFGFVNPAMLTTALPVSCGPLTGPPRGRCGDTAGTRREGAVRGAGSGRAVVARYPGGVTFPVVGMVGGGQLARMTHEAGIPLGIRFKLLSDTPQDSAAQVVERCRHRRLPRPGHAACVRTRLRRDHLRSRARSHRASAGAGGGRHPRPPGPRRAGARPGQGGDARQARRDRRALPAAPHRRPTRPTWRAFAAEGDGFPVVLKTVRGGYDGKGVWVVRLRRGGRRAVPRRRARPRRGEGRLRARAGRQRRPLPARPGRRLPGRGVRSRSTASATP